MEILKINGKEIKNPQSLEWTISDLDSSDGSGRNQLGELFRDRIATKIGISCAFPPMNDEEISVLLNAVEDAFFELEYPDARLGKRNTIIAYVGDRTAPIYMYDTATNSWLWQGLSMSFTER